METIIADTYEEMSRIAADMIERQLMRKPSSVLGLATGSTPVGLYRELVRRHKEQGLDFSKVITFNLDEYLDLRPSHPQSYRYFMNENLFNHINVDPKNIHVPYGHAGDVEEFCEWYEQEIKRAGGIDIQVLGIGADGHIAFNEPGSSLGSRTRLKTLTKQKRSRVSPLRWGSARSSRPARFCCWPTAGRRPTLSPRRSKVPSPLRSRPAPCKCTGT